MSISYTKSINDSIWTVNCESDNMEEAVKFLNNPDNFRTFSKGLTELMQKCGYTGSEENIKEKTDFLYNRLVSIGVSVAKSTVKDWFTDKRYPAAASNSRMLMYQICFALSASYEDMLWFFHHVYFERFLNCHTINEVVYYYCFSNHYDYSHAVRLIQEIDSLPVQEKREADKIFTNDILERLNPCCSDEELIAFFAENKGVFFQWNVTASEYIRCYLSEISKEEIDRQVTKDLKERKNSTANLKNQKNNIDKEINNCGLVIRELFSFRSDSFFKDIAGKNVASIDFMLDCIFYTKKRVHKNTPLPEIVCTNFPSKTFFCQILKKIDTSTSYDSIRKCLILLNFYCFWCKAVVDRTFLDGVEAFAYDIYLEEANSLLRNCGYEELFAGNPYDWLFLCAARTERPLDGFRDIICETFS